MKDGYPHDIYIVGHSKDLRRLPLSRCPLLGRVTSPLCHGSVPHVHRLDKRTRRPTEGFERHLFDGLPFTEVTRRWTSFLRVPERSRVTDGRSGRPSSRNTTDSISYGGSTFVSVPPPEVVVPPRNTSFKTEAPRTPLTLGILNVLLPFPTPPSSVQTDSPLVVTGFRGSREPVVGNDWSRRSSTDGGRPPRRKGRLAESRKTS